MILYSFARYMSADNKVGYIELSTSEPLGVVTIELHYSRGGTPWLITRTCTPIGGGVYAFDAVLTAEERTPVNAEDDYEVDMSKKQPDFHEDFLIYNNGVLLVDFAHRDYDEEPTVPGKEAALPTSSRESRMVKPRIYRLWDHYSWTPFQRKVSFVDSVPSATSAVRITITVPDDRVFPGSFKLRHLTPDAYLDEIADPAALFEGNSGIPAYHEGTKKVHVPTSDGNTVHVEEYELGDFCSYSMDAPSSGLYTTTVHDLRPVGVKLIATGVRAGSKYEYEAIPSVFKTMFGNAEAELDISGIDAPTWNFGNGDGRGLSVPDGGGITTYDNFNKWVA